MMASICCAGNANKLGIARVGIAEIQSSGGADARMTADGCAIGCEDHCLDLVQCRSNHDRRCDRELADKVTTSHGIARWEGTAEFTVQCVVVQVHDDRSAIAEEPDTVCLVGQSYAGEIESRYLIVRACQCYSTGSCGDRHIIRLTEYAITAAGFQEEGRGVDRGCIRLPGEPGDDIGGWCLQRYIPADGQRRNRDGSQRYHTIIDSTRRYPCPYGVDVSLVQHSARGHYAAGGCRAFEFLNQVAVVGVEIIDEQNTAILKSRDVK